MRLKSRSQRGASWSSGRVQTPTLSLLVKREMEVLNHQPEPYNRVKASFKAAGHEYEAYWYDPKFSKAKADDRNLKEDRIFDKKLLEIFCRLTVEEAVAREVRKPSKKNPPLLFDLTTLQRVANSRYGWSAQKTLRAAQRCYETHKVLTYPRTSSKFLPEDYREEVDKIITILSLVKPYKAHAEKLKKDGLLNTQKVFNDAGVTDHFAIIPTGEMKELEGDDKKLFDLVTRQFMAVFYPLSMSMKMLSVLQRSVLLVLKVSLLRF